VIDPGSLVSVVMVGVLMVQEPVAGTVGSVGIALVVVNLHAWKRLPRSLRLP
jgi:hypothetical protein